MCVFAVMESLFRTHRTDEEDGVEQATLVRQTTAKEELNGPVLRDCCLVPAQGRERDSNEEYARAVGLNEDELRMLAEIATGVTTDVVARRMDLSARTLRRRLRSICDRLGVNTPIEAVVWAARRHLI